MVIEIGRLVVKIAGRDARKRAIIVDILDDKYVLIDGETRRRKCNILHLEPLDKVIKIKKGASHEEVVKVFKELGLEARQTKPKPKTKRPRKKRKTPEQLRKAREERKKKKFEFLEKLRSKQDKKKSEEGKGIDEKVEEESKEETKIEENKKENGEKMRERKEDIN
jgi:large subunit ribosomal protein L14e